MACLSPASRCRPCAAGSRTGPWPSGCVARVGALARRGRDVKGGRTTYQNSEDGQDWGCWSSACVGNEITRIGRLTGTDRCGPRQQHVQQRFVPDYPSKKVMRPSHLRSALPDQVPQPHLREGEQRERQRVDAGELAQAPARHLDAALAARKGERRLCSATPPRCQSQNASPWAARSLPSRDGRRQARPADGRAASGLPMVGAGGSAGQ